MVSLVPNTTQVPHLIIREWMPKLSDTALRVILIIIDKTLGWEADPTTHMRKTEDWIAYSQLKKQSGRQSAALANALRELEGFGLIDIRDKDGNSLKTKQDRLGKKLYYRLASVTSSESEQVKSNLFGKRNSESEETKETHTKERKIISKDIILPNSDEKSSLKESPPKVEVTSKDVSFLIDLFKPINPGYEKLFAIPAQRNAITRLAEKYGVEKMQKVMERLPGIVSQKYAPMITTPFQLEKKFAELIMFVKREKGGANGKSNLTVIRPDPNWRS